MTENVVSAIAVGRVSALASLPADMFGATELGPHVGTAESSEP